MAGRQGFPRERTFLRVSEPVFSSWRPRSPEPEQNFPATESGHWDRAVLAAQPGAHFMQSAAWAQFRSASPWKAVQSSARLPDGETFPFQRFLRRVPGLGVLHHAPRVAGIDAPFVGAFSERVRALSGSNALAFKLELYQPHGELVQTFLDHGWRVTRESQYRNAVAVDLRGSAESLLASVKSRARYEIRVAERNNVTVQQVPLTAANIDLMLTLVTTTAERSGAFFRSPAYLTSSWRVFAARDQGRLYFASHEGEVLAGAFVFTFGTTGWYKDGGSTRAKSGVMAPRYLQWHIMRDLQAQGFHRYELGNIPAPATAQESPMWGLYKFKTAFAQSQQEYMPALEYPLSRRYPLWQTSEPALLRLHSSLRRDYWY